MNFINWRQMPAMPGTKPRKLPWGPDGAIDHLDPANWVDEQTARGRAGGDVHTGIVLPRVDPETTTPVDFLLDLDDARDAATGDVQPWATAILQQFPNAWCEVSHSGTGFHVMGQCRPAALGDRRNKWTPDGAPTNAAEFYYSGRFVALGHGGAGDWLDWTDTLARIVPERTAGVAMPCVDQSAPSDYSGPSDDDALIELMREERQRKGGTLAPGVFACDFFGDVETFRARAHSIWGHDPGKAAPFDFDGSSADFALMNHLAYYTGGDVARMERLFTRSIMGQRDKARARPQYVRDSAMTPAADARAAGRYLNRPTVESIMRQVQEDPTRAATLGEAVARMAPDERAAVVEQCKTFGAKATMQAAIKSAQAESAAQRGIERSAELATGPLAHYYIVENFNGAAVVMDERGGLRPQSRAAFRDAKSAIDPVPFVDASGTVRTKPASEAWWDDPDTRRYDAVGYVPGGDLEYTDDVGRRMRNTYRAAHGPAMPASAAQVEPWLHVVRANFPDPGDQHILLQALAFMVQRPGVPLRWAPVMQGAPGCGKGTIAEAVEYAHGARNVAHPSPDTIGTDFNGFMHWKTLIVVNEIGDHTKRELSTLAEKLKPWITDNHVEVVRKGVDGEDLANTCSWIFTTNHAHCMLASVGERRYAHFISVLQTDKACAEAFPNDWLGTSYRAWVDSGGLELVRGFLAHYDLSGVPSRAPQTSSTSAAVAASESDVAAMVREAVAAHDVGFRGGFVSLNALQALAASEGVKLPAGRFVARQLAALGYSGTCRTSTPAAEAMRFPAAGLKSRFYYDPGQARCGDRAVLSRSYEAAQNVDDPPDGNVVQFPV